jgi:ABC-type multidrug transport system ATPase subunit
MFAANLRYNKTDEQKGRLVDQIMKDMKLESARNTIVGGVIKKGISGGEKKRVNIGFELISNPQVLFLDEPTSGLDSYTSWLIITLLQKLAQRDMKTIIYTIHQPNSEIFQMFDVLMLLMNGKIIFHGNPLESIKYLND